MDNSLVDFQPEILKIPDVSSIRLDGKVSRVIGMIIESVGPSVSLGELCKIHSKNTSTPTLAEVVGFKDNLVFLMPYDDLVGINPGSIVEATGNVLKIPVNKSMFGRVINGLGEPIDDKGVISAESKRSVTGHAPHPLRRKRIKEQMITGIKAIDVFNACGKGQRMGIFAGSGVGKSVLLGMIAKQSKATVNVIALIGERGREVREFIERDLGEEGLKRSIVVVVTSDEPAVMKIKGAMTATAIAEYFREQGNDVILMLDSLTRIAMAQREIGLAVGEPPTTKGYTPSVFAMLPKLLERAGNAEQGSVTGLYTVLVEADDFNEPVSDTVRSIIDGHVVLSRSLAHKGHYPAIDILESISRVMVEVVSQEQLEMTAIARKKLAIYRENEDLINIGAYVKGSSKDIDDAIRKVPRINKFLQQGMKEPVTDSNADITQLKEIVAYEEIPIPTTEAPTNQIPQKA